mmetsp:Transcript_51206/g.111086  ORF Transcript_51206/g.111086 Transcript_51206/m.111086 type:complete len:331 (+) Transcript_51206:1313-2305(+)
MGRIWEWACRVPLECSLDFAAESSRSQRQPPSPRVSTRPQCCRPRQPQLNPFVQCSRMHRRRRHQPCRLPPPPAAVAPPSSSPPPPQQVPVPLSLLQQELRELLHFPLLQSYLELAYRGRLSHPLQGHHLQGRQAQPKQPRFLWFPDRAAKLGCLLPGVCSRFDCFHLPGVADQAMLRLGKPRLLQWLLAGCPLQRVPRPRALPCPPLSHSSGHSALYPPSPRSSPMPSLSPPPAPLPLPLPALPFPSPPPSVPPLSPPFSLPSVPPPLRLPLPLPCVPAPLAVSLAQQLQDWSRCRPELQPELWWPELLCRPRPRPQQTFAQWIGVPHH